jgi:Tfp pilus assembly protein PilX
MNPRFRLQEVARRGERGAVLITVMLVMLALLGLGVMALWMTSGNMQIASTTNLRNQALYVAEAGIEAVRNDLNGATPRVMTALLAGGKDPLNDNMPTGALVDAQGQPNGVGAVYFYTTNVPLSNVAFPPAAFTRGSGADVMVNGVSVNQTTTMGTYTVWIRNDTAELRMGLAADANGIFVVRSRGVAPDGRTQVTLEATMAPGGTPDLDETTTTAKADELCNSGKNGCWENSSVQAGLVVQ